LYTHLVKHYWKAENETQHKLTSVLTVMNELTGNLVSLGASSELSAAKENML